MTAMPAGPKEGRWYRRQLKEPGVAFSSARGQGLFAGALQEAYFPLAECYETQADLLRLLSMVCRHFAACCFSINLTRSFDAVRLVVVACLATVPIAFAAPEFAVNNYAIAVLWPLHNHL